MARCIRIDTEEGVTFVKPGKRKAAEKPASCGWCAKPGTKACDFPVRGLKGVSRCDAATCDEHAAAVGPNIDYCPNHRGQRPEL